MVLEEKEVFGLGASRKTSEVLPYFMNSWFKERTKRKINVKIIYNDTPDIRTAVKKSEENLGKGWNYRFLHTDYLSEIMTIVFGDKVMLATWKKEDPSAILIQNKDIAETYKQHILNLWKIAKK